MTAEASTATLAVLLAVALAAVPLPQPSGRITGDERQRVTGRRTGIDVVTGVGALAASAALLGPVPTGAGVGLVALARVITRRRALSRRRRRVDLALPDALDLFVVAICAGHRPAECFTLLAPLVDPVLTPSWSAIVRRLERGDRLADAVAHLGDELGPNALAFAGTLTATDAAGLALAPAVDRLADEARQHRRRAADAAARELPVRLSFPLVLCTLPSFVLVAIVPLLLGAISSLRAT